MIKSDVAEYAACEMATPDGVDIIDDLRPVLWRRTASLKARYKNLAMGDCIAIALAEMLDAEVLTGDRDFKKVATSIGIIEFR